MKRPSPPGNALRPASTALCGLFSDDYRDIRRNVRAELVSRSQSLQIGGVERDGLIGTQVKHHRRIARIVGQSQEMTNFVH